MELHKNYERLTSITVTLNKFDLEKAIEEYVRKRFGSDIAVLNVNYKFFSPTIEFSYDLNEQITCSATYQSKTEREHLLSKSDEEGETNG